MIAQIGLSWLPNTTQDGEWHRLGVPAGTFTTRGGI